jgi:hypothetical protein
MFSTPAGELPDDYLWAVDCNATSPYFGVEIDNQVFWHDKMDMKYFLCEDDHGKMMCVGAIGSAEDIGLGGVTAPF